MKFSLRLLPVLAVVWLLSGCAISELKDENRLLRARAEAQRQDFSALESRFKNLENELEKAEALAAELQTKLDAAEKQLTDEETDVARLKERVSVLQDTMNQSQRSQAEALMEDMESRVQKENELKLEVDRLAAALETAQNEKMLLESELEKAQASARELGTELEETTTALEEARKKAVTLTAERDDARAERDDFRRQVVAIKASADESSVQLAEVSEQLRDKEKELASAQRELEETQAAAKQAAEKQAAATGDRDAIAATLQQALAQAAAEDTVRLALDQPRPAVLIPSDALFQSGTVLVSSGGEQILATIAAALEDVEFTEIRIQGHTDNRPVQRMPFVDNWDLAAARASSVTRYFAQQTQIPASKLSAASFAFFDPIDTNDTPEGRFINRRVEVLVVP